MTPERPEPPKRPGPPERPERPERPMTPERAERPMTPDTPERPALRDRPTVSTMRVRVFTVPTDAPEADGTAAWDSTTAVVVTVSADGVVGTGWSYTDSSASVVVDQLLSPVVLGCDAFDIRRAATSMERALRNAGAPGIGSCARSAVDLALWDLKARLLDVSLADLLGRARSAAEVYGSGGFTTYDDGELAAQLSAWVTRDHVTAVKIKIGEAGGTRARRDLERVAIARDAIGPEVRLMVDANGGYAIGEARRVELALRDFDVRWFEEPVTSDDPRGLASVRATSRADIAAGEYVYRLDDARRLLEAGAVDCLQLDVTRCGGVTGWLDASAAARAHHVDVSAHCAPNLAAHVVVATEHARHIEYFHDHARIEPMLFDGTLTVRDGMLTPDLGAAGHGMTLSDRASEYERRPGI